MFSIEYLAGIFDGEGSVGINKLWLPAGRNPRHSARVSFGMVDERPVKEFHRRFGGYLKRRTNQGGNRPMWNWQLVGNKTVKRFLEEIMPHIVVKRLQAELLYMFCNECKAPYRRALGLSLDELNWREGVYEDLKALNRGEAPATTKRENPARGCDSLNFRVSGRGLVEVPDPLVQ